MLEMLCQIVEEGLETAEDFLLKKATLNLERPADVSCAGRMNGIISCAEITCNALVRGAITPVHFSGGPLPWDSTVGRRHCYTDWHGHGRLINQEGEVVTLNCQNLDGSKS